MPFRLREGDPDELMTDTTRSRLDHEQRRELRDLGWRWLGRRRAKRPRSVSRRHRVPVSVDDETALVDLETNL